MALFTEVEEPEFIAGEALHRWFPHVLLAECGELSAAPPEAEVPDALNWLRLVPPHRRDDFEEVECGLVYISPDGTYTATVWDATGEEDDPWAVFWVDDLGPRLLTEYSLFDEEMSDEARETILRRAADEIPERAERGEFIRGGEPIMIPPWLMAEIDDEDEIKDVE